MRTLLLALASLPLAALVACSSADSPAPVGADEDAIVATDEYDEDVSPSAEDVANESELAAEDAPTITSSSDALPDELTFDTKLPEDDLGFEDVPPLTGASPLRHAAVPTCGGPIPANCAAKDSLDVVMYYEHTPTDFVDAFCSHASACERLRFLTNKVAGLEIKPRIVPASLRMRGPRVSPSAEFHWSLGWQLYDVEKLAPGKYRVFKVKDPKNAQTNWYLKGVVFRKWMALAGYLVSAGDTWHINEVPSTWTQSLALQQHVRAVVRGLHDGDPDDPSVEARLPARGVVLTNGLGETTKWRAYSATTVRHQRFWADMSRNVAHFGVERYLGRGRPFCNGGSIDDQTTRMNASVFALPELARTLHVRGSTGVAAKTAHDYLYAHYTPILDMAWEFTVAANDSPPPLLEMERFVSGEVYAARAYAADHPGMDGRIGIYLRPKVDAQHAPIEPQNLDLSIRLATSLRHAYINQDRAAAACPDGNPKDCVCSF